MKNFLPYWFELVKLLGYLFVGLVPMMVFVIYSPSYQGVEFDALYSLGVWIVLGLIEVGQTALSIYIKNQNKEENFDEDQTKR